MFVALVLCLVDVATGEVEWCNAAHPPPLVVAPDGAVERLHGESTLPLVLRAPLACTVGNAVLAPGSSLFIYTDGITEAMNEKGEMFGESRLRGALASIAGRPAREMLGEVLDEVRKFAGASEPSDDIAAMILRWCP